MSVHRPQPPVGCPNVLKVVKSKVLCKILINNTFIGSVVEKLDSLIFPKVKPKASSIRVKKQL